MFLQGAGGLRRVPRRGTAARPTPVAVGRPCLRGHAACGANGLLGSPRSRNVILPAEVTFPRAGAIYRQRRPWLIGITSAAEDRDARFSSALYAVARSARAATVQAWTGRWPRPALRIGRRASRRSGARSDRISRIVTCCGHGRVGRRSPRRNRRRRRRHAGRTRLGVAGIRIRHNSPLPARVMIGHASSPRGGVAPRSTGPCPPGEPSGMPSTHNQPYAQARPYSRRTEPRQPPDRAWGISSPRLRTRPRSIMPTRSPSLRRRMRLDVRPG
jgi:hypothetical protein